MVPPSCIKGGLTRKLNSDIGSWCRCTCKQLAIQERLRLLHVQLCRMLMNLLWLGQRDQHSSVHYFSACHEHGLMSQQHMDQKLALPSLQTDSGITNAQSAG